MKAFMAAQLEKDKQIELVLEKILLELKRIHIVQQSLLSRNLPDLISDNPGEGRFLFKGTVHFFLRGSHLKLLLNISEFPPNVFLFYVSLSIH